MGTPSWGQDDLKTLRVMWPQGHSAADISRAIEWRHSRNAVLGMANRLVAKGHLAPRAANNREWRERAKDKPELYNHRTKPMAGTSLNSTAPKPSENPPPQPALEPLGPVNDFPGPGLCRFMYGDVRAGEWSCCARPGFPYCPEHRRIAWVKPSHPVRA